MGFNFCSILEKYGKIWKNGEIPHRRLRPNVGLKGAPHEHALAHVRVFIDNNLHRLTPNYHLETPTILSKHC